MPTTFNAADGLLSINNGDFAARWNFPAMEGHTLDATAGIGEGVTLSYSFSQSLPSYASGIGGFVRFTAQQQAAATAVLQSIADVADIQFVRTGSSGQITFANSSQPNAQGGFAYLPYHAYSTMGNEIVQVFENPDSGDVWLNSSTALVPGTWQPGQQGYHTLLHELGHALGLKHSFDGFYTVASALDSDQYTVMSYTPAPNSIVVKANAQGGWTSSYLRASTLMLMDIDALQTLYGANTSTRAGNTTYSWDRNEELLETVWDGGGRDTIDASNQVFTCLINLEDTAFSSIGLRQTYAEICAGLDISPSLGLQFPTGIYNGSNNLAIARGTVIENAAGGSAADVITGNAAANSLSGNGGNDKLVGGAGNDTLNGGSGADSMTGGKGDDRYAVDSGSDRVVETRSGGHDLVLSYLTSYTLGSEVEDGRIMANGSANLTGNGLHNVLYAGKGNNVLSGGAGNDTVSYEAASKGVVASLAASGAQATRGSGTDRFSSIENLTGSDAADKLTGNTGVNVLVGGAGNDTLSAGSGNDRLWGGAGRDVLTGGGGKDLFDFDKVSEMGLSKSTRDVVTDFMRGQDDLDLSTIDARSATAANDAFSFIGSRAFSAAGQLRYDYSASKGYGVLYGNTDTDQAAEFEIQLTGVSSLSSGDFIV